MRGVEGALGRGVDGCERGKSSEKRLKGSLERNGGWRTLRNMLKLRNARLACGTYLRFSKVGRGRLSSRQSDTD